MERTESYVTAEPLDVRLLGATDALRDLAAHVESGRRLVAVVRTFHGEGYYDSAMAAAEKIDELLARLATDIHTVGEGIGSVGREVRSLELTARNAVAAERLRVVAYHDAGAR